MCATHDLNPVGLKGIAFVHFASPRPDELKALFLEFGFSLTHGHAALQLDLYQQGNIRFLVDRNPSGHSIRFTREHGPSIPAMGWKVHNAAQALQVALSRGAQMAQGELSAANGKPMPAIVGIGGSLIYFVEDADLVENFKPMGFQVSTSAVHVPAKGFLDIDHLTNNVEQGTMSQWSDFYKSVFGFTEVRYFDIRGAKTGLVSYALRSPDGSFCIPINEGTEHKSQINEYLREYKGPGVQHLALTTTNIIDSLVLLKSTAIECLDIDADYYNEVFKRVPNVTEDHAKLKDLNILVDGDSEGYLLQIFTKNIIGPIFFEIIQRKNHLSFGEGNFGALFRALERDQEKRGVL